MNRQSQETIVVSNPELFPINNEYYLSPNHMIADNNPICLPFPPTIEPKDLIVNKKYPLPNGKQSRAPNAFIIYRKAFVKAAREQGYILPMTAISSMASAAWEQENIIVKEEYKRIAKDAHKLVKEMFPKKSNQRKRKERWNLVSFPFQDKSSNNTNNTKSSENKSPESKSSEDKSSEDKPFENKSFENKSFENKSFENKSFENISTQELAAVVASTSTSSLSSSPNLSEFDGNISEKSFVLQPQQQQSVVDEVQISNDYLIDNLPYSYFDPNFYLQNQNENNFLLTNWLNQPDINTFETFETLKELDLLGTPMDDLKINSQSSLNMTLSEAQNWNYNNYNF